MVLLNKEDVKMISKKLKHITAIGLLSSTLMMNGCTPEEQAFAAGVGTGVVVASVYTYPRYYGYPYYYYGGRYYYGGYYRGGYYYYHGKRYRNGHYYHGGYRYYNGKRYKAQVGHYGYYNNKNQYNKRHTYKNERNVYNVNKSYSNKHYKKEKRERKHHYNDAPRSRTYDTYNVNRTRYR